MTPYQIHFINLVVEEPTSNGFMHPGRLFETPYTDRSSAGADHYFVSSDVDEIVEILGAVTRHAGPSDAA